MRAHTTTAQHLSKQLLLLKSIALKENKSIKE
jgi:hypothetical protein